MSSRKNIRAAALSIFLCFFLVTGCDNISNFFQEKGKKEKTESSREADVMTSEGMRVLTGLLDEQQRLIDEVTFSKQTGNTELMRSSFDEVMRLEQQYQDEFDQFEQTMTRSEIREISNRHSDIIDTLPRL